MSSRAPALLVDDLVVRFDGRPVLDSLSLRADIGVLTAILGPNGAGKTTLIRCCTGLLKPDVRRARRCSASRRDLRPTPPASA